jgi:hypothetical protein
MRDHRLLKVRVTLKVRKRNRDLKLDKNKILDKEAKNMKKKDSNRTNTSLLVRAA